MENNLYKIYVNLTYVFRYVRDELYSLHEAGLGACDQ